MNYNLFDVTRGERLWMWRMRVPLTEGDAAKNLGVPLTQYRAMEQDDPELAFWNFPPMAPVRGDLCRLARRRMGWDLDEAAKQLGYSPTGQLEVAESNDDFLLLRKWVERGFRFIPEADMIAAFKRPSEPEN